MGGFSTGFQNGINFGRAYNANQRDKEEFELKKQKHARDLEESDQRIEANRRSARVNQQLDEETAGIRSYINNGTMTGNNSGFSDESARMMFAQGGAGAVNEAASYGNAEARRLGLDTPYQTGAVSARSYDPSNPDDQTGLNRRLMSVAALRGDYAALGTLQDKNKELADTQVFNRAVQQFSMNPDSFTDTARWINKSSPVISTAPAKDPRTGQLTGYNIMTVTPSGDAVYKFVSPQQAATLAGATALMQVNPTKALQLMGTVDASLAQAVAAMNTATQQTTTANNTVQHYSNQDDTARENAKSNRIQANAAASNAQTNKDRAGREKQTEGEKLQEKVDAYSGILRRQDPKLSKEEADKKAADILLRDPNAKEQDVGLAEAGIFRKGKKYYKLGKSGQPEEVQFPGESKLDKALEAYAKGGGAAPAGGGQQLHDMPNSELQRIARKPRGVSSAEANAAAEELDRRKREPRLSSF